MSRFGITAHLRKKFEPQFAPWRGFQACPYLIDASIRFSLGLSLGVYHLWMSSSQQCFALTGFNVRGRHILVKRLDRKTSSRTGPWFSRSRIKVTTDQRICQRIINHAAVKSNTSTTWSSPVSWEASTALLRIVSFTLEWRLIICMLFMRHLFCWRSILALGSDQSNGEFDFKLVCFSDKNRQYLSRRHRFASHSDQSNDPTTGESYRNIHRISITYHIPSGCQLDPLSMIRWYFHTVFLLMAT